MTMPESEQIDCTQSTPVDFVVQGLLSHLLRRAHFFAEAEFPSCYRDLNVTSRQLALFFAINNRPGSSQTELAEAVGFDANTFSDLAKRSERKGLLKRVRSPDDGRAFGLYLTAEGRDIINRAASLTPAYQERITKNLNASEADEIISLLHKLLGLD
jgi:DNA-binding MarR family transcriptional regulator